MVVRQRTQNAIYPSELYYPITMIGQRAGLMHMHPHMLRHSCGYALADKVADARLYRIIWTPDLRCL